MNQTVHKKFRPSQSAAHQLRKAVAEDTATEIFCDLYKDRFETTVGVLANYFDGLLTQEQAQQQIFSLMKDTALDQFADDIPESEYNAEIMPGFVIDRQAG